MLMLFESLAQEMSHRLPTDRDYPDSWRKATSHVKLIHHNGVYR